MTWWHHNIGTLSTLLHICQGVGWIHWWLVDSPKKGPLMQMYLFLIDSLIGWLIDWLIHWLIDWLIDWLDLTSFPTQRVHIWHPPKPYWYLYINGDWVMYLHGKISHNLGVVICCLFLEFIPHTSHVLAILPMLCHLRMQEFPQWQNYLCTLWM